MIRKAAFILGLAVMVSTGGWADDTNGPASYKAGELSIQPGIALFSGDAGDYHGNSFSLDGQWLFGLHDVLKFGPEVGYIFGSNIDGTIPGRLVGGSSPLSFSSDVESRILHITPELKLGPVVDIGRARINPYIIGGGGYYWTHYTSGTGNASGIIAGGATVTNAQIPIASGNDHNGGWNVGIGTSLMLPQNFGLGFEVRYHHIVYKGGDDVSWFTPAARITFYFR